MIVLISQIEILDDTVDKDRDSTSGDTGPVTSQMPDFNQLDGLFDEDVTEEGGDEDGEDADED